MKEFYFFGIKKKGKMFAINDPLVISDSSLYDLNESSFWELFRNNKLRLSNLVEEFMKERGILFGVTKSLKEISKLLKYGRLLSPEKVIENLSIYFIEDKKCILFKINKIYHSWKDLKKYLWKILEPLKVISKKDFAKFTKDWKDDKYDNEIETFYLETKKFKLCIGKFYCSFVCIKPKNYNQFKNKVEKVYKNKSK